MPLDDDLALAEAESLVAELGDRAPLLAAHQAAASQRSGDAPAATRWARIAWHAEQILLNRDRGLNAIH
ncbi:MAG: hypothetical protein ACPGO3_04455 [Magnetospiraceae bacterium]